jgi:hypothetical protein
MMDGMNELTRIAVERTLAGQRCAAVKFTGSDGGLLVDFDADGQVVDSWRVPTPTSTHETGPSADE